MMEMAKAMLKEKGLPNTLSTKATYSALYLLNRCPTKVVQNNTSIEALRGCKPSTRHLKVFGSICYVHN